MDFSSGFGLDFLAHARPEEEFMGQFTRHHRDVNIPLLRLGPAQIKAVNKHVQQMRRVISRFWEILRPDSTLDTSLFKALILKP